MKKMTLVGAVLTGVMTSHAWAFDKQLDDLNLTVFETVDANEDGMVSRREAEHFRDLVMLSMDSNGDEQVTLSEYMFWDLGWAELAKERNRLAQYRQARADVFEVWDSDGDGTLSQGEQMLSNARDFYSANDNSNDPMDLSKFSTRLRIMAAMNEAVTGESEPVTLINVFDVPAGKEEESIRFWEEGAEFLSGQPGYISTALHQTILPDARFSLINVAKWESIETFQSAIMAMRTKSGIRITEGLIPNASLYKIIRSD